MPSTLGVAEKGLPRSACPPLPRASNRRRVLLVYLALAAAAFAAYEPVRWNEFVRYDDNTYITGNPVVQNGLTRQGLGWAFTTGWASNWHPLTWLSHMLDCDLFALNPLGHHIVSLLLHAANALLLLTVLRNMTGALWASAFVAAAFALHPLHVESVAWAAERKDVLSALFFMLTIAAYLRYARRPGLPGYLLTICVFVLGLMAKPMLVTTPVILLLLDYWPLGRFPSFGLQERWLQARQLRRLVLEKVPLLALSLASCVVTVLVQRQAGSLRSYESLPFDARIANALVSYVVYLLQTLWPVGLAPLYPHPVSGLPIWQPLLALAALTGLFAWAAHARRRRPYLFVGWLWYVIMLLPVIGLVQVGVQAHADRYTYLPLIGIFLAFAWGVGDLSAKRPRCRPVLISLAAVVLFVLLLATRVQVCYWRDSVSLFTRALAATDNNFLMHYDLAVALKAQGRIDEAVQHLEEAVAINPHFARAHLVLGAVLAQRGDRRKAALHLAEALRLRPDLIEARQQLDSLQAATRPAR